MQHVRGMRVICFCSTITGIFPGSDAPEVEGHESVRS